MSPCFTFPNSFIVIAVDRNQSLKHVCCIGLDNHHCLFIFLGCFQGWMSMPGLNSCYAVVNFSKSFEEHAEKCKLIYGEAIDLSCLNSLKMLMFFFRIIVETFMKNSYSDMVKSIIAITKRPYNIHQLGSVVPICQREKSK